MACRSVSLLSFFFVIKSLLIIISFSFKYSKAQMLPAMFVFGDSGVDVGNNNYLPSTIAKADFPHNGIDFPTKKPTGRFSNGKNAADFLAEKLSLPISPPYLSFLFNKSQGPMFLTGVNFASGGSGLLNKTGQSLQGSIIPLTEQVDDYSSNVYQGLVKSLGSAGTRTHLSKSLFVIVTGSNDLLLYHGSSDLRKNNTAQQYVDLMILTLEGQIKRLHSYGASKFLVTGLGTIGCIPAQRIQNKAQGCNEDLNYWSFKYNEGLKSMLQQLKLELADVNYSYFDTYSVLQNIIQKPVAYGFTEVETACCGLGKLKAEIPCIPISTYCSNRSNHVFWDAVHPTEATVRILVDAIFDGPPQYTFPMNVRQLVAA